MSDRYSWFAGGWLIAGFVLGAVITATLMSIARPSTGPTTDRWGVILHSAKILERPREIVYDCVGLVQLEDGRKVVATYPDRACRGESLPTVIDTVNVREYQGISTVEYTVTAFRDSHHGGT